MAYQPPIPQVPGQNPGGTHSPGSAPPKVGPAGAARAGNRPPGAAAAGKPGLGNEQPTVDELPEDPTAVQLGILQSPFIQNILPFLTSLLLHVGIIAFAIATYTVATQMAKKVQEQYVIVDSAPIDGDGGIPHPGLGGDPDRDAKQDKFPEIKDSTGISDTKNNSLVASLEGAAGDTGDVLPGLGAGTALGHGHGQGVGNGEGGGPLAPYGLPGGGGGLGPKGSFAGMGNGGAKRIVFICDATGSMVDEFDNLRRELRKAIEPMRPPQAMNVVFIQEGAPPPIDPNLLLATPENKRKLIKFVDDETPRKGTDPDPALKAAFAMHPQLIYLLCDPSDFPHPQETIDLCKSLNADRKTKVLTICFENHEGEKTLKQIASDSGGDFKFISAKDLGE